VTKNLEGSAFFVLLNSNSSSRDVVGFDDFMCFEEPNGDMPVDELDEMIGAEEDGDLDAPAEAHPWIPHEVTMSQT